jgi:hypothetical protein
VIAIKCPEVVDASGVILLQEQTYKHGGPVSLQRIAHPEAGGPEVLQAGVRYSPVQPDTLGRKQLKDEKDERKGRKKRGAYRYKV